jgi:hypothetical protein
MPAARRHVEHAPARLWIEQLDHPVKAVAGGVRLRGHVGVGVGGKLPLGQGLDIVGHGGHSWLRGSGMETRHLRALNQTGRATRHALSKSTFVLRV